MNTRTMFRLDSFGAFLAHFLESPDTPFVAGTACLDSLPDPDFLFFQFLVEQGLGTGFRLQRFFLAPQVVIEIARPARERAAVDFHDSRRQALEKCAVVSNEHYGAIVGADDVLEPLDGDDVEMIGRLVQ